MHVDTISMEVQQVLGVCVLVEETDLHCVCNCSYGEGFGRMGMVELIGRVTITLVW